MADDRSRRERTACSKTLLLPPVVSSSAALTSCCDASGLTVHQTRLSSNSRSSEESLRTNLVLPFHSLPMLLPALLLYLLVALYRFEESVYQSIYNLARCQVAVGVPTNLFLTAPTCVRRTLVFGSLGSRFEVWPSNRLMPFFKLLVNRRVSCVISANCAVIAACSCSFATAPS